MVTLVTGAGGFVGRRLVDRLVAAGHSLVALDANVAALPDHPAIRKVAGNLADGAVLDAAVGNGVDAVVHLAAVPGGAAEENPRLSREVNIDAALELYARVAATSRHARVVFSSTIAVFGDPLPVAGVDDHTPLAPRMIYGAHKAMMETALANLSRRGEVDAISLRLPGIIARPKGPSGMRSAFLSDAFHNLAAGEAFTSPVSPGGHTWVMSVDQCVSNLVHALGIDTATLPTTRAVTLPALNISMADYLGAILQATGADPSLVRYAPDPGIEAGFGAYPTLNTPLADRLGFRHDGSAQAFVDNVFAALRRG